MSKQSDSNNNLNDNSNGAAGDVFPKFGTDGRASAQRTEFGECVEGAKSPFLSNTGLDNCNNDYFKLLRFGVDSLYLSYQGDLFPEVQDHLSKLKLLAQNPEIDQQALAQYTIAGHIFEVKDKGSSVFPYVLEDGAFRIQLSRASKMLPMAYVKLSSSYLSSVTPKEAEAASPRYPE